MTHFEFLAVFISIVLALGVSDVLSGWGEQIRFRDRVRPYWLHTVWGVLYLLASIQAWWGLWRFQGITDWTFIDNLILILPYLLLALIAYVLTPSSSKDQTDVRSYYYKNAPWIFGLGAVFVASLIVNTRNALGTPLLDMTNVVRVLAIILMVALATVKNERFHIAAVILAYLLLATYIPLAMFAL